MILPVYSHLYSALHSHPSIIASRTFHYLIALNIVEHTGRVRLSCYTSRAVRRLYQQLVPLYDTRHLIVSRAFLKLTTASAKFRAASCFSGQWLSWRMYAHNADLPNVSAGHIKSLEEPYWYPSSVVDTLLNTDKSRVCQQ